MPPQKAATGDAVFQKLGKRLLAAHEQHAGTEVEYGNMGDLPAGINGGVARLVDCKFGFVQDGKTNAGELYFSAAGVCVSPKEFQGQKTEGLRASIMEMIMDTPDRERKTVEDHMGWVYNELAKLGVDKTGINPQNLTQTCEALKAAAPFFKFRTYSFPKREPKDPKYNPKYDGPDAPPPRVNCSFLGHCEYTEDDGGAGGVDDGTGEAPPAAPAVKPASAAKPGKNGAAAHAPAARVTTPAAPAAKPGARPGSKSVPKPAPEPEPEVTPEDPFDLDALAEVAAGEDGDAAVEAARAQLTEAAGAAGVTDDQINAADGWAEVVGLIKAAQGGDETDPHGNGASEAIEPVKGDMGKYRPPGKDKAGKPFNEHEVEVTAVDKAKKTVTLKSVDDKAAKPWAGVPWDQFVTE